ncbi:MAG: methanethiol S-methyltransferase [Steroidobacteraceae bacterium]
MKRFSIFVYGVVCYAVFLGVFLYGIGFIGGFGTPTSLDATPRLPVPLAIGCDLALLMVFAVQHSGMARAGFKRWWTRVIPPAAERSTYVLLSSLALAVLYVFWQPIGGIVWQAEAGWARDALIVLNLAGWGLLLFATFLIDHFDLFGLAQVWRQLRGGAHAEPQFRTPSLYRVVRHPLYVGWLVIFWAAPVMTIAHLLFALVTTAYILVAIRLEERDLVAVHGAAYTSYQARTPMLVPTLRSRRRTLPIVVRSLVVLMLVAGTLSAAPADAAERVRFTELDVARPTGARALYVRLQRAAGRECQSLSGFDTRHRALRARCIEETVSRAVAELDRPLVTALHRRDARDRAVRFAGTR